MSRAIVPAVYRYRCFVLATDMAAVLDWLMAVTIEGETKTKYEHLFGKKTKFASHLRIFGQLGVVAIASRYMHSKVDMRGINCMMCGYTTDHAGDVYKMYDPIKNIVYKAQDVKWHRRMYFETNKGDVVQSINYPITTLEEQCASAQQPAASAIDGTQLKIKTPGVIDERTGTDEAGSTDDPTAKNTEDTSQNAEDGAKVMLSDRERNVVGTRKAATSTTKPQQQ